jgi:hypothetical protein
MKYIVAYLLFALATYGWLYLDTLYYRHKKPTLSADEIRRRISDADEKISLNGGSDCQELDLYLDIKEYWERELAKIT